MSGEGLSVRLNAKRPGDMFLQLAALASIVEKVGVVYYNKESLFFDYRNLDIFFGVKFVDQENCLSAASLHAVLSSKVEGKSFSQGYSVLALCLSRLDEKVSIKSNNVFNVFLTFEAEKRRWLNQLDVLDYIVRFAKRELRKEVVIVNNGMTQNILIKKENYKLSQMKYEEDQLGEFCSKHGIKLKNLFGLDFDQKIPHIKSSSLALGSLYTGNFLPNVFQIPTVSAGNSYLHKLSNSHGLFEINQSECVIPLHLTEECDREELFADKKYKNEDQLISYKTFAESQLAEFLCKNFN